MERTFVKRKTLSFSWIELRAVFLGTDVLAWIEGGDRPHIGSSVIAVPRPSLTGDGSASVTSSVMNVTGHKDEALCRRAAEEICRISGSTVVCAGGFHADGIQPEEIREVLDAVDELLDGVREWLRTAEES